MDSIPAEIDPVLGRVIDGKYEIQSLLGGGGMGKVYKARHRALDKIIAIKVLHGVYQSDAKFAQRFEREALAASKLNHPNGMQVLDFGREPDGLLYIAMEFLAGQDLHKMLLTEGLPTLERTVEIMSQVLAALQAAHDQGIVHRDMKPENIVIVAKVSDDGTIVDQVKVCDFGIAKIQDTRAYDDAPQSAPLTTAGMVCGTPEFMSPEQARGLKLDSRSDLYSCGVVLFQMATGRLPFTGDSAIGIVMKHIMDSPPLPSEFNSEIPPSLENVIMHALEKDPAKRPQTARELRAELRALVAPGSISSRISAASGSGLAPAVHLTGAASAATVQAPATPGHSRPSQAPRPPASALRPMTRAETGPTVVGPVTPPRAAAPPMSFTGPSPTVQGIELPPAYPSTRTPSALIGGGLALVALAAVATWLVVRSTTSPDEPSQRPVAAATPASSEIEAPPSTPAPAPPPPPAVPPSPAPATADTVAPMPVAIGTEVITPSPSSPPIGPDKRRTPTRADREPGGPQSTAAPAPAPAAAVVAAPLPAPAPVVVPEPAVAAPVHVPPPAPVAAPAPHPAPAPAPAPTGPLQANATITIAGWEGSSPRATGLAAANRLRGAFEGCYQTAAQRAGRNNRGAVTVSLTIDENGRARSVRTSGDPLPGVSACVRGAMGRLAAARPDTGTVDASFRVEFTPRSR